MGIKQYFKKSVPIIWRCVAITFFIIILLQTGILVLVGLESKQFNSDYASKWKQCAEFCGSNEQPLFMFDWLMNACQCYDDNERPANFINFANGEVFNDVCK